MCGISGIIGKGWRLPDLLAMVKVQHHRGPDSDGTWISDDGRVGLGHNRLSIIDLSTSGSQPMEDSRSGRWIVLNGEIYNYIELKQELFDYPYRSATDTEVVLAAYDRWGEKCVDHFIGMFAFAIWDPRKNCLFCARDRLGIKPFHYVVNSNLFLFASEIKAILASGFKAEPNHRIWADYLVHGYFDHSDDTFFAGIKVLPPGCTLTVNDGEITICRYWDLADLTLDIVNAPEDEVVKEFRRLLNDSVRLRLRSDVPVGVNLSGGLDSASLLVTVDDIIDKDGEIQTFTAGYDDPQYDEKGFADSIITHSNWKRNYQRLAPVDVIKLADEVMWHQEAPFGGVSTIAYHYQHKLAKEMGVTVLLEGQGVDEMLAGYNYMRPYYLADLIHNRIWAELHANLRGLGKSWKTELSQAKSILSNGGWINVYQDGTNHLRPEGVSNDIADHGMVAPNFDSSYPDSLRRILFRDLRWTKLPRVLRMNDRLSMAFSRELREPYLDHRIVEYLFRLPGHLRIKNGLGKYLLRRTMTEKLPRQLCWSGKRAVVSPQREWFLGPLRSWVIELINSSEFANRGYFKVSEVKRLFDGYCKGDNSNAFFIWQWINVELWHRQFINKQF